MRIGSVTAHSFYDDVDRIYVRVAITFRDSDPALLDLCIVVQPEHIVRLRPPRVEAVLEQRARAADRFFGWLTNKNESSVPFIF